MSLATTLRTLREDAGLSRARLAVASGVSPSTIARIELEAHEPNVKAIRALADALDVDPGELLEADPEPQSAA